jgi:hypothetical protein
MPSNSSQADRRQFLITLSRGGEPERAAHLHVTVPGQGVDFKALPGSKLGELSANVDIVLGRTFNERTPTSPR